MRISLAKPMFLCVVILAGAASGLAQSGFDGKWATDRPADPQLQTEAQRKQSVQLEVAIADAKASGALAIGGLGGTFHTFQDAKVTGNKIRFEAEKRTWTIELVDGNTVMLHRGQLQLPITEINVQKLLPGFRESSSPNPVQPVPPQRNDSDSLRGVVLDQTNAVMPGVTVRATNVDTGAELTTLTNASGYYGFANVRPGNYTLSASLVGFTTTTIPNFTVGDTPQQQVMTLALPSRAPANPTVATCSAIGVDWCAVLHRAK